MGGLFLVKKLIPLVLGIVGIFGAGSYGAFNYFGREILEDISLNKWFNDNTDNDPELISAEYIVRNRNRGESDICKRWKGGKKEEITKYDCEEKVKKEWGSNMERRPEVWFKADEQSLRPLLLKYFPEYKSQLLGQESFPKGSWKVSGLVCRGNEKDETEKKFFEISCEHQESDEPTTN
ncbi:hypothetical protein [Mycoplasma suis]|uniref:Uncharacterized protein n=1 Tax=Mycoplasma suis (strain Illinois) TaxID=768700 RepID=F0QQK0_MYCSL|nr:hypothetical protein [Mycoplasma suis]ADX97770.1 hypothetical protein MSU_0226 [Mycoplasma suis str. Illinois]